MTTADADGDRDAFKAAGFGMGETLEFRRPFAGTLSELGFRLAFLTDRRSPDLFLFTCQPLHETTPDRSAITSHGNGVVGIRRVVLGEPNPTDFQYLLQEATGDREMEASSFAMSLRLGSTSIEVATPAALALRYASARDERRGLSFEGIVLSVRSLGVMETHLAAAGARYVERDGRLVLWLTDGPSGFIAFEEDVA